MVSLSKILPIGVYFAEHIFLVLNQNINIKKISISSQMEVIIDTYFFEILNILLIFLKKTDFRFDKVSDIVVYDRPSFKIRFVVSYIFSNADRELKVRTRFVVNSTINIIMSISEILNVCS